MIYRDDRQYAVVKFKLYEDRVETQSHVGETKLEYGALIKYNTT